MATVSIINMSSDFQGCLKMAKITIDADFDNTEQASGFTLPAKAVVLGAFVDVTTADASQTLDVGTDSTDSGDADGFIDGISVNAAGMIGPTLADGAATLGALLRVDESSGDLVPEPDYTSGGKAVTFTGSDTTNTCRGSIYIKYLDISSVA